MNINTLFTNKYKNYLQKYGGKDNNFLKPRQENNSNF